MRQLVSWAASICLVILGPMPFALGPAVASAASVYAAEVTCPGGFPVPEYKGPGGVGVMEFVLWRRTTEQPKPGVQQVSCQFLQQGVSAPSDPSRFTGVTIGASWVESGNEIAGYCGPGRPPDQEFGSVLSQQRRANAFYLTPAPYNLPAVGPAALPLARGLLPQAEANAIPCGGTQPVPGVITPPRAETRPLCPEAIKAFGPDKLRQAGISDPQRSGIRVDGGDLLGGFRSAIKSHNARFPDDKAYVSRDKPFAGTAGALAWLFSEGGGIESWTGIDTGYVTGKEKDLYSGIRRLSRVRQAEGKSAKLLPSDVLEVALGLTGGDLNAAILTAHNTLRAQARDDNLVHERTGLLKDPGSSFFDTYLADLRDGPENPGLWYHTFGTAYLEVSAADDSGPWLVGAGAGLLYGFGLATGPAAIGVASIAALYAALESKTSGGVAAGSEMANAVEQYYRENLAETKRIPDPEKYCFNVWGAQAGRSLYEELPYKSTRKIRDLVSSFRRPPRLPPASYSSDILGPFLNVMSSPYSVEWSDGQRTMVLDQGADISQARLLGDAPVLVLPLPEPDSWGALWVPLSDRTVTVRFEAAKDGAPFHLLRVDTTTGKAAIYETTTARASERLTISLDASALAPPLARTDGSTVAPKIVALDLGGASTAPPIPLISAVAGAAVLLVAVVTLAARRRRRLAYAGPPASTSVVLEAQEARSPSIGATPLSGKPNVTPTALRHAAPEGPRFCRQCGQPLRPTAAFCGHCGTQVRRA